MKVKLAKMESDHVYHVYNHDSATLAELFLHPDSLGIIDEWLHRFDPDRDCCIKEEDNECSGLMTQSNFSLSTNGF